MKRKFLEDMGVLSAEQIDSIMKENGNDINAAKADVTSITTERDNLKDQLKDRDVQIDNLKKIAGDNDKLTKQIEQLQAENKAAKVDAAVQLALTTAKAKNVKAVRALLEGLDKAEFADDGSIKGLADQIKKLQTAEDSKFLFEAPAKPATPKGATPDDGGDDKPTTMTKADFNKLSTQDQMNYIKDHPNWQTELK